MSEDVPSATDFDGLIEVGRGLLQGWTSFATSSREFTFGQRHRRPDEGRFISVYGLSAHVHQVGRVVLELLESGSTLESAPLVRLMYESSITSVWLAQNEEAARSFMNKEVASRRALAQSLARSATPWIRQRAEAFPGIEDPFFDTSSDAQARHFERLCNDLTPGGDDAYVNYRLLSRLSHATPAVLDRYLAADSDGEFTGLRLDPDPTRDSRELFAFYAVAALVWAGAAVDYMDPSRRRRSETRQAARLIGVPRDLELTPEAQQRIRTGRVGRQATR